ncbi:hypothetical protein OU798_17730 [Prolixibacteraceae bacterium Z1-6]|uniref:Uncharacterized protein n=1 Tax=Draconibacterium aestuarii TaxID=2998507 RepID=A0A9X3F7X2_9BACT|nr:hypothetical protein [Prolixibacteraceae bacterium Z1-6]
MGTVYEEEKDYFVFVVSKVVGYELTAKDDYTIDVKVVRTENTDSASVNVELEITEDIDGLFALETEQVSFEAGSSEAYARII